MPTAKAKPAPLGKYGRVSPGIQPVGPPDDSAPHELSMLTPKQSPRGGANKDDAHGMPSFDGLYPCISTDSVLKVDGYLDAESQHFNVFNFLGIHLENLGQMLDAYAQTQYLDPESKSRIQKEIWGAMTKGNAFSCASMPFTPVTPQSRGQSRVQSRASSRSQADSSFPLFAFDPFQGHQESTGRCQPVKHNEYQMMPDVSTGRLNPVVRNEVDVAPEDTEEPQPRTPYAGEIAEKKQARVFMNGQGGGNLYQSKPVMLPVFGGGNGGGHPDKWRDSTLTFTGVSSMSSNKAQPARVTSFDVEESPRRTDITLSKGQRATTRMCRPKSQHGGGPQCHLKKGSSDSGEEQEHKMSVSDVVDFFVAFVILLNAFILGLSSDLDWDGWQFVEYFFTVFFLGEMLGKMYYKGVRIYFFGPDYLWNLFDFCIVMIALVDCGLTIVLTSTSGGSVDLDKFVILKMARLGRLARLVRLLRFRFFKELKVMIQGVFAGLRVLFWAVVLFLFFIYFLAIALVRIIGDDDYLSPSTVQGSSEMMLVESFGKVPWGMLTLFRCFTDGCTAPDGTPLQVHAFREFGAGFLITYMLTILFVSIGLFNLIMAIFVDNVMESKRQQKQEERAMHRDRVERELRRVVSHCATRLGIPGAGQKDCEDHLDTSAAMRIRHSLKPNVVDSLVLGVRQAAGSFLFHNTSKDKLNDVPPANIVPDDQIVVTREFFCDLIAQPDMELTLEHLDIDSTTRDELFDILDADMSGELDLDELVDGLMSLRGPTEKKDCVGTLLAGRVTQQMVKNLHNEFNDQCTKIWTEQQTIKRMVQSVVAKPNGTSHAVLARANGKGPPSKWRQNGQAQDFMDAVKAFQ